MTNDTAFKMEQRRLGHLWTLLGITDDVKNDGDWIRATLGGRSVFVQRFGDTLKGFENRCAHRSYPLRTSDRGNGPVVCGFHHWRYNQDGQAIGIPICPEVFGVEPRQLGAKLDPVEIATCGSLIFGRFPRDDTTGSLAEFLGEGFPILDTICTIVGKPHLLGDDADANWKLLIHITLDDYHTVAIHHREQYARNSEIQYFRFGRHSAHFVGDADTLASMADACGNGRYRPTQYRIFNIFPNLAISLFAAAPYWYCIVQQFVPVAPGRSAWRGWFFRTKLPADEASAFYRFELPGAEPIRARIIRHHIEKTADEDHRACERLQTAAHQIDGGWPILGSQEKRIEWFEDSYAQALGQDIR